MAYDTSKHITLGQGMTIASATKASAVKEAASADNITYKDGVTVADALNDLLYEAIAISSFTNTVGTVEIGTTVNSCTFKWAVNKTPTTLSLGGGEIDVSLTSYTMTEMSLSLSSPGSKSYVLTATDEREAAASKTTYIYFYNGVCYGVGSVDEDGVDNDFVLGLTKALQNSKTKSFTVTAGEGEYIYYALPARLGTPTFYVGGFEGGFNLIKTFDFTNSSGYSESYNVYKSTNANLGSTTVSVS